MPWGPSNLPSSPTLEDQIRCSVDQQHFALPITAMYATRVITGMAVTQRATPSVNMSVDVAPGEVISLGIRRRFTSVTNIAIGNNTTSNPRLDLVVVNAAGTVAIRVGGAATDNNPAFTAPTLGDVVLAAVYVDANNSSAINTTEIDDLRIVSYPDLAPDGWQRDTFTRTSNVAFTVARDTTRATGDGSIDKGTRIMIIDGASTRYGTVASASNSSGTTTVTMITNSDYPTVTAIDAGYWSNILAPSGYPSWFSYTATPTGCTSPTIIYSKFSVMARKVTVIYYQSTGTGSLTTFTVPAPVTSITVASMFWLTSLNFFVNSAQSATQMGRAYINSNSATITLGAALNADNTWVNSGTRAAQFQLEYEF